MLHMNLRVFPYTELSEIILVTRYETKPLSAAARYYLDMRSIPIMFD